MRFPKFSRWLVTALLGVTAIPALAAASAPPVIKVGTLYASSGPFAAISMPVYKGLKLWVKDVNAAGGVYVKPYHKKIPVKLVSYNDQSSTSTAATLYNRLLTKNKVHILVSDSGSVLTSVAVPIAQEHKMLLFDQTGTGSKFFSSSNRYIVALDDPVSSLWPKWLAEFLKKVAIKHHIHKVAILFSTNDFTGSQATALKGFLSAADSGVKVVYYHGVPTSTSSYLVLIHRIAADHPDALLELGYPDNDIAFLRDLQSSGLSFPLVFSIYPGLEKELMQKNVGKAGMLGDITYVPATSLNYKVNYGIRMPKFKQEYRKAYGKNVDVGFNAVAGYNTGLLIQKTLATTNSMKQLAFRKAIFNVSGKLHTLDGLFKLNKDGAQIGELTPIGQIQPKGKGLALVPVYPRNLAQGRTHWAPYH